MRERVQFEDCAIVAPRDALYGVLRVFEIFSEKVFREVLVFRSLPEAEAWLPQNARLASVNSGRHRVS